jgi:hypothetical protein
LRDDARDAKAGREALIAMDSSSARSSSWITGCIEDLTQRDPKASVCSAFGLGLFLHVLPLGAIVGWSLGAALSLVRPALLAFGIVKACELCGIQFNTTSKP